MWRVSPFQRKDKERREGCWERVSELLQIHTGRWFVDFIPPHCSHRQPRPCSFTPNGAWQGYEENPPTPPAPLALWLGTEYANSLKGPWIYQQKLCIQMQMVPWQAAFRERSLSFGKPVWCGEGVDGRVGVGVVGWCRCPVCSTLYICVLCGPGERRPVRSTSRPHRLWHYELERMRPGTYNNWIKPAHNGGVGRDRNALFSGGGEISNL